MNDTVPEAPTRVFLLIENRLLRDALQRLLKKRSEFQMIGCSEPQECSAGALLGNRCDVLVLDFFDTRWLPVSLNCKAEETAMPRAVLIGMSDEIEQFLAAIRGGAVGYLLKEASAAEVVSAVRATARGEAVCPPRLCAALFEYVAQNGFSRSLPGAKVAKLTARPSLTLRQQRLIALVANGLTNKEIASRLNISEFTVKNHIHRILRNVDAQSRSQAVEALRSHGYSLSVMENA